MRRYGRDCIRAANDTIRSDRNKPTPTTLPHHPRPHHGRRNRGSALLGLASSAAPDRTTNLPAIADLETVPNMKTSTVIVAAVIALIGFAVFKLLAYFQDINNPD